MAWRFARSSIWRGRRRWRRRPERAADRQLPGRAREVLPADDRAAAADHGVSALRRGRVPDWTFKTNLARRRNQEQTPCDRRRSRPSIPSRCSTSRSRWTPRAGSPGRRPPGDGRSCASGTPRPAGCRTPRRTPASALKSTSSAPRRCDSTSTSTSAASTRRSLRSPRRGWSARSSTATRSACRTGRRPFREEFEKRRGYDLRKYMPAMTGRVVGSPEITERFLWDLRRAQADLMRRQLLRHVRRAVPRSTG